MRCHEGVILDAEKKNTTAVRVEAAMAEQDQAARCAARRLDAPAFLRELMGEPFWQAWRFRGWQDSQAIPFPGEPDRRLDTLAWFDRPDGASPPLALAIEFLANACADVLPRMAEYTIRVHREVPFQENPRVPFLVIGVVVNLLGSLPSNQWSMLPIDTKGVVSGDEVEEGTTEEAVGNLGLMLTVGVRNLEKRSARACCNEWQNRRRREHCWPFCHCMPGRTSPR
jgi:hypothetical protein